MTAASARADVVAGPPADCAVDSEGAMTMAFALPDLPDHPDHPTRPEPRAPELLLRLRPKKGSEHDAETQLRVPLTRGGDGRWRAVLPPDGPVLAEGRWDVYAVDGAGDPEDPEAPEGPRRRLTPGVRDLRLLLDRRPEPARSPLAVRIPYTTKDGYLAVRAWLRTAHAEAGEIGLSGDTLTVRARLLGARLGSGATAVLRRRGKNPVVHEAEVRDEGGGGFSFTFGYRELTGARVDEHEFWDLFVRPDGGAARRVRIGRLLDDVADRKNIFTFPAAVLDGATVRPYYTVDNDLSVDVTG